MTIIQSIHDKTFKHALKDIRVARDFFEEYLPKNVLALLNLETLKLSPNSYVDEDLNATSSDVLYEVQMHDNNTAFVYILCEHQSTIDPLMPYRLWSYMVRAWGDYLKQTGNKYLPIIYPIVFYHGKEPYTGCRSLSELIKGPDEIIQEVLFKPFHLIDTHEIEDETLRERRWAGVLTFFFSSMCINGMSGLIYS